MSLSMSSGADMASCILTAHLLGLWVFLTIYTGQGLEQIVVPESLLDRGGNWIEAARTTSPRMCNDDISEYIIQLLLPTTPINAREGYQRESPALGLKKKILAQTVHIHAKSGT